MLVHPIITRESEPYILKAFPCVQGWHSPQCRAQTSKSAGLAFHSGPRLTDRSATVSSGGRGTLRAKGHVVALFTLVGISPHSAFLLPVIGGRWPATGLRPVDIGQSLNRTGLDRLAVDFTGRVTGPVALRSVHWER